MKLYNIQREENPQTAIVYIIVGRLLARCFTTKWDPSSMALKLPLFLIYEKVYVSFVFGEDRKIKATLHIRNIKSIMYSLSP